MIIIVSLCTHPISSISCLSKVASLMHWFIAMYFAFIVNRATVCCHFLFHDIAPCPTKNNVSKGSPTIFHITGLIHTCYVDMFTADIHFISTVHFKYRMICLTAIQCIGPNFDINRLTTLTANARSNIVATIVYINDPIASWYKVSFIL